MRTITSKEAHPLLMLMDGHALVYRAWFAIQNPLTISKTGEQVQAVYGFASTLLWALSELHPTHCAIAFDPPGPTFRHQQFKAYKAQRAEMPQDLRPQFDRVRQLIAAFGIVEYTVEGYEADDALGTLCRQAEELGLDTVILTGDTDTLQLVSPRVRVLLSRGIQERVLFDEARVQERYSGLGPCQQPDVKALQGDASDNIPGVPGVGAKIAVRLIQQYGSVEVLLSHLEEVTPPRLRESLQAHRDQILLGKALATIVTRVPVTLDLEETRFWRFDRSAVLGVLRELEFTSLVPRVPEGMPAVAQARAAPPAREELRYRTVATPEALGELVAELRQAGAFALDTETTGENPLLADLVGLSFSTRPGSASYVPVGHRTGQQLPLAQVLAALKSLLEDPALAKVAHNANYDLMVLGNYDLRVENLAFDTMVAAFLVGEKSLGLKELAFRRLNLEMTPIKSLIGTGRREITMAQVPIEAASAYACADADVTLRLKELLDPELERQGLALLFTWVEMPLVPVLVRMQRHGVALDVERLQQMSRELLEQLWRLEEQIYDIASGPFNINSPQQLSDVLFNRLRLPKSKRTKTGYSTDATVLAHLRAMLEAGEVEGVSPRAYEMLGLLLEFRELGKLKSTYVDALPSLVNPQTGRVHTSYNQTGSATGRVSSNDPNLQNIPVRTELGRGVRRAFVAGKPGWVLLAADYSQIELRVLAHLSRDQGLLEAFARDEDIHAATASLVYGVPLDRVAPEMRRLAKVMNFGVIYGLTSFGLSQQTGMTQEEGSRFIEQYFGKYPDIRQYLSATIEQARSLGYVETVLGRRRYIPEINASSQQVRQAAERMAVNMPVQGSAADIIKLAMIRLQRRMDELAPRSRMLLQVHDELIFELPEGERGQMEALVQEVMPHALDGFVDFAVSLKVEIKAGHTWGDME